MHPKLKLSNAELNKYTGTYKLANGDTVELKNENDFLDNFGGFVRLRCAAPDCGHEDWYKEPVFQPAARVVRRAPEEGPGEVWVHDVMLGLSFKTESTQNHE